MFRKKLWEAADHLIAEARTGTVQRFDRWVPLEIVRRLQFVTRRGLRGPVFSSPGELDEQTVRVPRELTQGSAELLDSLL